MKVKSTIASAWIACAGLGARAAEAQPRVPTHVACVGDSITVGYTASSLAKNYTGDLQTLLGAGTKVGNFGHSGATMLSTGDLPYVQQAEYGAATTFVANAGAASVVDVVIMLGTNDSKPQNWANADGGTSAGQFAADYLAMIDHFAGLATHPLVLLAAPPTAYSTSGVNGTIIHDQIVPIVKQVATQNGMPFIDVQTPTAGHREWFVSDGIHPNDMGYQIVANVIYTGLTGADSGAWSPVSPEAGLDGGRPDSGGLDGSEPDGTEPTAAAETDGGAKAGGEDAGGAPVKGDAIDGAASRDTTGNGPVDQQAGGCSVSSRTSGALGAPWLVIGLLLGRSRRRALWVSSHVQRLGASLFRWRNVSRTRRGVSEDV
jgi:acyl-CoA thioesterase-1